MFERRRNRHLAHTPCRRSRPPHSRPHRMPIPPCRPPTTRLIPPCRPHPIGRYPRLQIPTRRQSTIQRCRPSSNRPSSHLPCSNRSHHRSLCLQRFLPRLRHSPTCRSTPIRSSQKRRASRLALFATPTASQNHTPRLGPFIAPHLIS
jgi:hypothetical protein